MGLVAGCRLSVVGFSGAGLQVSAKKATATAKCFMAADSTDNRQLTTDNGCDKPTLSQGERMDDIERDDDDDYEDEQIEQMIIDNGILLHSLATLLVRKGILKQEEIDAEMDRLYDEMESFDQPG
jgi:hypothetical protein